MIAALWLLGLVLLGLGALHWCTRDLPPNDDENRYGW